MDNITGKVVASARSIYDGDYCSLKDDICFKKTNNQKKNKNSYKRNKNINLN